MTTPILDAYGIGQLATPCWTIVMADGTDFDPTGCWDPGHFETREDAETRLLELASDDRPAAFMELAPESFCCTTLILVCGDKFIYQGEYDTSHFVDDRNLRDCMDVSDVVDLGANRYADRSCCATCDRSIEAMEPVYLTPRPDQIPAFPTPEEIP